MSTSHKFFGLLLVAASLGFSQSASAALFQNASLTGSVLSAANDDVAIVIKAQADSACREGVAGFPSDRAKYAEVEYLWLFDSRLPVAYFRFDCQPRRGKGGDTQTDFTGVLVSD